MKKILVAFAVLTAVSAVQAQSSLTLYGSVDVNYSKETEGKAKMNARNHEYRNHLGIMGAEDLGGGLKATFQLEKRFSPATGEAMTEAEFEGAANVGLAGAFGHLRFGRVNELSMETYRLIDPFQQYGVAGMLSNGLPLLSSQMNGQGRLSNTVRYDSPMLAGLKLGASFTVQNDGSEHDPAIANNGWALSGTYDHGPLYLVANYHRAANSADAYKWNLGAAYAVGSARLSLGYEKADMSYQSMIHYTFKNWIAGVSYKLGNGTIKVSYNQADERRSRPLYSAQRDWKQYGLGYTHALSKRTDLYANGMHYRRDYSGDSQVDSYNAVECGVTHRF